MINFHGYLSSCVGPVVDIQVCPSAFLREKIFGHHIVESGVTKIGEGIFRPCVLDSCGIIRPTLHLRNGPIVSHYQGVLTSFLYTSLTSSSPPVSLLALIPGFISTFRL